MIQSSASRIEDIHSDLKLQIKRVRPTADRNLGLVQLTGKELQVGQTEFPMRTPADPMIFIDRHTGEVLVYGTQVEGTGFTFLKYKNEADLLRGAEPEIISQDIYLPNGQLARGQEMIWDTYRLSYQSLLQVFPQAELEQWYRKHGIDSGTDLFYGGISLQQDGSLGRWTADNWRRRIHAIASVNGRLTIIKTPIFNEIKAGDSASADPSAGMHAMLPGNYLGHSYGANFKLVEKDSKLELWMIKEEVTRRVESNGRLAEVTEIVGRKMISPFQASEEKLMLVSADDETGNPHPDSCRGSEMGYTKLLEGFRPMKLEPQGLKITKRVEFHQGVPELVEDPLLVQEYFLMTGSQGNFAGDAYDVLLAFRKESAIGKFQLKHGADGKSWKKYLKEVKERYRLSWAGRATFVESDGGWWLVFHAIDKDVRPQGSYAGVIPPDTHTYHRNLYAIPIDFYIDAQGEPDMLVRI